jgi:hypothetical protein
MFISPLFVGESLLVFEKELSPDDGAGFRVLSFPVGPGTCHRFLLILTVIYYSHILRHDRCGALPQ